MSLGARLAFPQSTHDSLFHQKRSDGRPGCQVSTLRHPFYDSQVCFLCRAPVNVCVWVVGGGSGSGTHGDVRVESLGPGKPVTFKRDGTLSPQDKTRPAIFAHCCATWWVVAQPLWASFASLGMDVAVPHP